MNLNETMHRERSRHLNLLALTVGNLIESRKALNTQSANRRLTLGIIRIDRIDSSQSSVNFLTIKLRPQKGPNVNFGHTVWTPWSIHHKVSTLVSEEGSSEMRIIQLLY